MSRFVGRDREIRVLSSFVENEDVHGMAVYGIRQVGKTSLLLRFAEGRRAVYIQMDRGSERSIVESAVDQIREGFDVSEDDIITLPGLIGILTRLCEEAPTLIILDEYQYLSSSLPHADTTVQRFADHILTRTRSHMIICGSQMSSMLDIIENRGNPLYNRFRMSLEVKPLTFHDTCLLHPGMEDRDQIRMYMVFGGMPGDHLQFRGSTFRDVVERTFLAEGLPFGNAVRARIGSELGRTDEYVSIVRAIASGRERLKEISDFAGLPESTCSGYISDLEGIRIVGRRHPMLGATKRPCYVIEDGLVGLWYSAFGDLRDPWLPEDPGSRYDIVSGRIDSYLGRRFERFCAEWLSRSYVCDEIGSWWGTEEDGDGDRVGADVDIVARVSEVGVRMTLLCECKFRNRMAKMSDLETLERRMHSLCDTGRPVIFSSGGFERELAALAQFHGAMLIGIDELMGRVRAPSLLAPPPASGSDEGDRRGSVQVRADLSGDHEGARVQEGAGGHVLRRRRAQDGREGGVRDAGAGEPGRLRRAAGHRRVPGHRRALLQDGRGILLGGRLVPRGRGRRGPAPAGVSEGHISEAVRQVPQGDRGLG